MSISMQIQILCQNWWREGNQGPREANIAGALPMGKDDTCPVMIIY